MTIIFISGLNHTAKTLAVYASRFGFPTRARLASGWLAYLYRVGFVPTGLLLLLSRFRYLYPIYSKAPDLSWRQLL